MISSSLYLVLFNTYNYLPEWVYTSLLPCNWIVTNFLTYSFIFCSGSGYVVVVLLNLTAFCVRLPIITWLWQLVSTKLTVFVWCNACFKPWSKALLSYIIIYCCFYNFVLILAAMTFTVEVMPTNLLISILALLCQLSLQSVRDR